MKLFKNLRKALLHSIIPSRCAACNKLLGYRERLCPECEVLLRRVPANILENYESFAEMRSDARQKFHFSGLIAPFYYVSSAKDIILNYKVMGRGELAELLAEEMAEAFKSYYSHLEFDFICFVPNSLSGRLNKGFDHMGLLSKKLSPKIGLERKNVLKQIKRKKPQHKLSRSERIKNVRGIYALKKGMSVKGKRLLLIDDIVTTGSSLNECAKILMREGAKSVHCLSCSVR